MGLMIFVGQNSTTQKKKKTQANSYLHRNIQEWALFPCQKYNHSLIIGLWKRFFRRVYILYFRNRNDSREQRRRRKTETRNWNRSSGWGIKKKQWKIFEWITKANHSSQQLKKTKQQQRRWRKFASTPFFFFG